MKFSSCHKLVQGIIILYHFKLDFTGDGEKDCIFARCIACPRELHLIFPTFGPC